MELWNQYLELRISEKVKLQGVYLVNEGYSLNWNLFNRVLAFIDESLASLLSRTSSIHGKKKSFQIAKKKLEPIQSYVQGLLWCLFMYSTGSCPDYSYTYCTFKAPSIRDLFFYSQCLDKHGDITVRHIPDSLPLPPLVFCITILPLEAKDCLPQCLKTLMNDTSPIYDIFEPTDDYRIVDTERVKQAVQSLTRDTFQNLHHHSLTITFAPSILMMKQQNHSLPKKSFVLQTPKPPLPKFNNLRYPSGIQAIHFDTGSRKYNIPRWPAC